MSFARKTNQHQRRATEKLQAGLPHPLQTIPPLPFDCTTYSACCISQPGHHDCCTSCKSEIVGVYIETRYFYILNEYGLPIELWESTNNRDLNTTTYKLQWRRPDINYIAQYNRPNYHPTPGPNDSISYKPHPLIGREQKPIVQSVIWNSTHLPMHKSQQTNLEYRASIARGLHGNWSKRGGDYSRTLGRYLKSLVDGHRVPWGIQQKILKRPGTQSAESEKSVTLNNTLIWARDSQHNNNFIHKEDQHLQ